MRKNWLPLQISFIIITKFVLPYLLQAIYHLADSRCAAWHKIYLFNIIAIIEFEILLFGQNRLISNIINTINLQNIIIVSVFSYNI